MFEQADLVDRLRAQMSLTQADLDSVTSHEIDIWLFAIAGFDHTLTQSRREQYVQGWNVRRKIAIAKKTGEFSQLVRKLEWLHSISESLAIVQSTICAAAGEPLAKPQPAQIDCA